MYPKIRRIEIEYKEDLKHIEHYEYIYYTDTAYKGLEYYDDTKKMWPYIIKYSLY